MPISQDKIKSFLQKFKETKTQLEGYGNLIAMGQVDNNTFENIKSNAYNPRLFKSIDDFKDDITINNCLDLVDDNNLIQQTRDEVMISSALDEIVKTYSTPRFS